MTETRISQAPGTPSERRLQWIRGVPDDVQSLVEARAEIERLFALLLQRQTFDRAILDSVDVAIIATDAEGRVSLVNPPARAILGREGDLEGEDVLELLALPQGTFSRQMPGRWAHALIVDGREIEIDLLMSRSQDGEQQDLGFFLIFHDRTRDKQLEMERWRLERLAAMGTLVAGFAHEVRNPMASLRSIAESLNDELIEAGVKLPHVGRMLKVLARVENLVRSSLLFGRPSPPRLAFHQPWMVMSSAVSALVPRTKLLGAELCIESDPDLPDVYVDDGQLVQMLVILLNNALDAAGNPSRVLLRVSCDRHLGPPTGRGHHKSEPPPRPMVRFEVRDEGPGIPAEIMGQIFDPFFTTRASGIGLGLSIAQQLATENGSRIELTSPLGGPTTFSVLVPITDPESP